MKRFCGVVLFSLLLGFVFLSCSKDLGDMCQLNIKFSSEYDFLEISKLKNDILLKGVKEEIPDTNNFILSVINGTGESIYYGAYRDKPEEFILDEGGYTVSVSSITQMEPLFNMPQYGDSHVVFLQKGDNINLTFLCRHINSGIKINYSSEFVEKYPDYTTTLKSGEYVLGYPYSETRIAYFIPARVELLMKKGSKEDVLFTRDITSGMVLTLKITASLQSNNYGIDVVVDTTKIWVSEDISWGGSEDENIEQKLLTVKEAKKWVGAKEVWVKGYIVGGDLSTSKVNFSAPFKTPTNFAISDNRYESNRESCMSVELKSGEIRDALNLVENPSNLKKMVYVKGEIVDQYFGLVGVKNMKGYRIN